MNAEWVALVAALVLLAACVVITVLLVLARVLKDRADAYVQNC